MRGEAMRGEVMCGEVKLGAVHGADRQGVTHAAQAREAETEAALVAARP